MVVVAPFFLVVVMAGSGGLITFVEVVTFDIVAGLPPVVLVFLWGKLSDGYS